MNEFQSLILVIPDKPDSERFAVADAWHNYGGEVLKLGRFWEPPEIDRNKVRLYGDSTFCLVLEQKLNLKLVSPPDDILTSVSGEWLKRTVRLVQLKEAYGLKFPVFIKSLIPKVFRASVYRTRAELSEECSGLEDDTRVIVSDIVKFVAEARSFVLNGKVKTCAVYEGDAAVKDAERFTFSFAENNRLFIPKTCVIDVGCLDSGEWALIETNATWGSGLNDCNPEKAAECIAYATTTI
ncbi:MAG: ATP-grasp domain-containing protein [Aestuariibacter sp.]|nr:ATP-grasp domain-containing protein [Aestuariibacter sp.]